MKIKVGIFIFDDVEILDFTGPYEVFSSTRVSTEVLSKKMLIVFINHFLHLMFVPYLKIRKLL